MIYIELPVSGASPYYKPPVAAYADLPLGDVVGTVRLVTDEGVFYWWDGVAWDEVTAAVLVTDTDSVDLTFAGGSLKADLKLSSNAADALNQLVTLDVESSGVHGLRAQITNARIQAAITTGNLTDVGTDGIVVTGGTGVLIGSSASIAQHVSDSTHNGYLSSTDWTTFNNKQAALTIGNLTDVGTDGIVVTGGTGSVIGSGTSIAQHVADSTHNGYLTSTDWTTFNSKQAALTIGNFTDAGTDGIVVTGGTGAIIGSGTSIAQHVADASHNGYLSSTDWSTFNSKEPAIASGTTTQYWRGDKSFQTLAVPALLAVTSGAAASTGQVNEVLTASQVSNTSTGVGATGVWGAVTSLSLTAGRWRIFGSVGFHENGADLTTSFSCACSNSATASGVDEFDTTMAPFLISSTSDAILPTPYIYANLAAPTTYYLNSLFNYTSGTPQHRGKITAERIG